MWNVCLEAGPGNAEYERDAWQESRPWLVVASISSRDALSQIEIRQAHLKVRDEISTVGAQGATVDGLPPALEQHQLLEALHYADARLVDGGHCTPLPLSQHLLWACTCEPSKAADARGCAACHMRVYVQMKPRM